MKSPDTRVAQSPSATACYSPRLSAQAAGKIASSPEGLIRRNASFPVKISRESLIVEARLPGTRGDLHVAFRRFLPKRGWKALAAAVRTPKAWLCWQRANALRAAGIATPEPLVACWPRSWFSGRASYLAIEWIEGAENLHLFGWRIASLPAAERLRLAVRCAKTLGRLIGRMHVSGVSHRDLKPANLLVVQNAFDVAAYIVDLEGVRIGKHLDAARRAHDLARLAAGLAAHPWAGPTLCLRFLRSYLAESPGEKLTWKDLWRAVAERAGAIIARKKARGEEPL